MNLILLFWSWIHLSLASPILPDQLEEWQQWVLTQHPEYKCIDQNTENCSWLGNIDCTIAEDQLTFVQQGHLDSDGWVSLIGNTTHWPINVKVNSQHQPIIEKMGAPSVWLEAGPFLISGTIAWNKTPSRLDVPKEIGIVRIQNGRNWEPLPITDNGLIVLSQEEEEATPSTVPVIDIHRLWTDGIPPTLKTQVSFHNGSSNQNVDLGIVFTEQTPLLTVHSSLNHWFSEDEHLWVSVPNGLHLIEFTLSLPTGTSDIPLSYNSEIWPEVESWAIQTKTDLRQIRMKNLRPIAASQTTLPLDWQSFPTYQRSLSDIPAVEEIHRGDPTPRNNRLRLSRTIWPKLTSDAATAETMLDSNYPLTVHHIEQNGFAQTILENSTSVLIPIRNQDANIIVQSETNEHPLHIQHWNHRFDSIMTELRLPTNWKLLYWNGWSWNSVTQGILFNVFLYIGIISWRRQYSTMDTVKLFCAIGGGLIAPVTTFIWQILSAISEWKRQFSWMFFIGVLWCAAALYESKPTPFWNNQYLHSELYSGLIGDFQTSQERRTPLKKSSREYYTNQSSHNYAVQMGTSLPEWTGESIRKEWTEGIDSDVPISILVVKNSELRWLALLVGLCTMFIGWRKTHGQVLMVMAALWVSSTSEGLADQPMPSPSVSSNTVLDDFTDKYVPAMLSNIEQQTILDANYPRNCITDCISIPLTTLHLEENSSILHIWMEVHAAEDSILPIPGPTSQWTPSEILLEGTNIKGIRRNDQGYLEVRIPKGIWSIEVIGTVDEQTSLNWPEQPKQFHTPDTNWSISGLNHEGQLTGLLHISAKEATQEIHLRKPWIRWSRSFTLESQWIIQNTIEVISAGDTDVFTVSLPTLDKEISSDTAFLIEDGQWNLPITKDTQTISWNSQIPIQAEFTVHYPDFDDFVTSVVWEMNCGLQYDCSFTGLPPIVHHNSQGHWNPMWLPYSGEQLSVKVDSLSPVKGENVQIQSSDLQIQLGTKSIVSTLSLQIESSQASEIPIDLPNNSEILSFTVDSQQRSISRDDQLTIFTDIGSQQIEIKWKNLGNGWWTTLPTPDIGAAVSNSVISVNPKQHLDAVWATHTRSNIRPSPLIALGIVLLMSLALAKHPNSSWSFRAWLFALLGVGHLGLVGGGYLLASLLAWQFIERRKITYSASFISIILILVAGFRSWIDELPSLWLWRSTHLEWYTDVTTLSPVIDIILIPQWVEKGFLTIWIIWILVKIVQTLKQDNESKSNQ